jgi:hypothetical protein
MNHKENEITYVDRHNNYRIFAVFEGDYVRWSRIEGDKLEDEEVTHYEDFNEMIAEEQWRVE